jgi:hypothetical protein
MSRDTDAQKQASTVEFSQEFVNSILEELANARQRLESLERRLKASN